VALPETITVRLIDAATDELEDRRQLSPEQVGQSLRLTAQAQTAGAARYRIEVAPGQGSANHDRLELNTENNTRTVSVEIIDRPLRVLYVEGYPRWAYRYLKNLLIREQSIESSIMLLSAGSDFAQEGDVPINRLPRTAKELRGYDIVVIGDAAAGAFPGKHRARMRAPR